MLLDLWVSWRQLVFLVVTNLSIHPSRLSIKSTVMVWKEERLSVFAVWQPVKEKVPLRGIEGGFILSLSGACFGCLPGRQHRNGLGVRADLRSCWEWYQKHFLFYRPSSPMLSVPHISKLSYSGSDNSKFLIPAFNISLQSSARSIRASQTKKLFYKRMNIIIKNQYAPRLKTSLLARKLSSSSLACRKIFRPLFSLFYLVNRLPSQ